MVNLDILRDLGPRFATEKVCARHIADLRWPEGLMCSCGKPMTCVTERKIIICTTGCRKYQKSVLAGTRFADSKIKLKKWFEAFWLMASSRDGINALTLQSLLGLRNMKSATVMLSKIRGLMSDIEQENLSGPVDAFHFFLRRGDYIRTTVFNQQPLIAVAVMMRDNHIERIKLRQLFFSSGNPIHVLSRIGREDEELNSFISFIMDNVQNGSILHVDVSLHPRLIEHGYQCRQRSHFQGTEIMSKLKQFLIGTYHGGIRDQNLIPFLDEFAFHYNRRSCHAAEIFDELIKKALT